MKMRHRYVSLTPEDLKALSKGNSNIEIVYADDDDEYDSVFIKSCDCQTCRDWASKNHRRRIFRGLPESSCGTHTV